MRLGRERVVVGKEVREGEKRKTQRRDGREYRGRQHMMMKRCQPVEEILRLIHDYTYVFEGLSKLCELVEALFNDA